MFQKTLIWFRGVVDKQYDYHTQQKSCAAEMKVVMIKTAQHKNITCSQQDSINEAEGEAQNSLFL